MESWTVSNYSGSFGRSPVGGIRNFGGKWPGRRCGPAGDFLTQPFTRNDLEPSDGRFVSMLVGG